MIYLTVKKMQLQLKMKEILGPLQCYTLQVCTKGPLLSSCYSLLENVIGFMTSGPSLALDEKRVKQLYTAMVGAFNAVMVFLKLVKDHHQDHKLDAIVLASVRALGAWIAEETSALKTEILELLPFVLDVG